MLSLSSKIISIIAVLTAIILGASIQSPARNGNDASGAGTVISNRAEATYQDETGENFTTASETVTITVMAVATVAVTPDETAPSNTVAPHEQVARLFRVCNTGNNADTFTITHADLTSPATLNALYFDNDNSGAISNSDSLITINETQSPQLSPGGCVGVLALVDTKDAALQSTITISLAARSNSTNAVNGRGEDIGTIINSVNGGPNLTDPGNTSLPPQKLVSGLSQITVSPGGDFSYEIAFRNSGDSSANNVIVIDQLPPAIEYVAGSLDLDGRKLTDALDADEGTVRDGRVEVRLARVDPGDVVRISFRSRLSSAVNSGTGLVNKATITGDNLPQIQTSPATVVVSPFGFVYAGHAGSSAPISGARVEVLRDQNGDNLLQLPANVGFAPNEKNLNPFSSDGQGRFSFALNPDEFSNEGASANYFLKVTAQGFVNRMMQLGLRRTQPGLFAVTVHALDSQPLAVAGGFDLIRQDVQLNDLAALALNVPMFETSGIQITKSADRAQAEIGDTITYRIEVHNPGVATVNDLVIEDHLPASFHYVAGSALFSTDSASDQTVTPEEQDQVLRFHFSELLHGATVRLMYRVRVGANAREGGQENIAAASGMFPTGERAQTPTARATVVISAGIFSTKQTLVGRVFVDVNHNGQFDSGDRPAPGIRLYLSNGQSVITDSAGLYNFPSLGDGPQVISLDPVTVPKGYALSDGGRVAGKSWTRLLRTPIGGGALLRQNFALQETGKSQPTGTHLSASPTSGANETVLPNNSAAKVSGTTESTTSSKAPANGPGTYEVTTTETIDPVIPGNVRILSPAEKSVSMSPGLQVVASVALNWTVKLEVNGDRISDKNIGVRSLDHKNQVSTFTFVGINLKPGPNRIRCTAISPEGSGGHSEELTVMGRGPARRLEIVADRSEIQSGGNDSTIVRLKAFDQWGNPALDGEAGIETSLGQLQHLNTGLNEPKSSTLNPASPLQPVGAAGSQLVVQLEGGQTALKLFSSGSPGESRLHAQAGQIEALGQVHITSEMRPSILVGFAEMSFGKAIPEVELRNEQGSYRGRVSLFYSGRLPGDSMLTMSYDSQRPINRTAGRDRLFQLDPLDRVYPLFGDSSTRYEAAQSNSKLYLRVDHKRSYAMFGDYEADMEAPLAGYTRKLTGVKTHLEDSRGGFITVTGARPDTAFARDVFPAGSLSIIQLSNFDVLPGSEAVSLEVRDRRNPEVVISRETLTRSVDYNLDTLTGRLLMLRYISAFDSVLNLTQIVVTYEHRVTGMSSGVYTMRGRKNFKGLGLKLGFSGVVQRQPEQADFVLGGVDLEKTLPHGGMLQLAWARSQGEALGTGNVVSSGSDDRHDGDAYQLTLAQPLPFSGAVVRAHYLAASEGFLNPFGGTTTPGSRRGELTFELKPRKNSTLQFGVTSERNKTANVDNGRLTFSAALEQILNERVRVHLGFDHRAFTDNLDDKQTDSNLVTAGAEIKATDKLQVTVKREQNLGEADPTYPTQTTLGATYQVNSVTKLFFTQRLAAAPIVPIGDFASNGFALSSSQRETAVGVETRFGKHTSMTSRYQLENGINGTDSFAVIGLQERLPVTKKLSADLGFERGFHLAGPNESFNSGSVGFSWLPNSDFRTSARYEYRDRGGVGQLLALGAAGKLSEGITALSRFQFARGSFGGKSSRSLEGMAALAIRPLESERAGVLFSYTHRSMTQDAASLNPTRDRIDSLSTDGYNQLTQRLELYGHFALRFSSNGQPGIPFASTLSFITQARAQYLLTSRWDWAIEARFLNQPSSRTQRSVYATEAGFWLVPDLRLGGGYNFTSASEPVGSGGLPTHRGFYFTISSKLSNLFDLFGTSKAGLNDETPKEVPSPQEKH
jgi:uncharacterized repeat protein (TIGR01451 family)